LVGDDRIERLSEAAAATGATILSKGPTTVIASPGGAGVAIRFVTSGTPALATAGTGDVLSGVIAALIARGVDAPEAAALGAHLHGRAGARARGSLLAGALPALVGELVEEAMRHGC
jgi:NAD(P)H-hydrate repair Nnr-like enzyme with NAD(P)H-hydrate dehydratase domain